MIDEERREAEATGRAERDPKGFEKDWLTATDEQAGEKTLEEAIDDATGTDTQAAREARERQDARRERDIRSRFG